MHHDNHKACLTTPHSPFRTPHRLTWRPTCPVLHWRDETRTLLVDHGGDAGEWAGVAGLSAPQRSANRQQWRAGRSGRRALLHRSGAGGGRLWQLWSQRFCSGSGRPLAGGAADHGPAWGVALRQGVLFATALLVLAGLALFQQLDFAFVAVTLVMVGLVEAFIQSRG